MTIANITNTGSYGQYVYMKVFWTKDKARSESDILNGTGVIVDEMHIRIKTVTICWCASSATYLVIQSSEKYSLWNSDKSFAWISPLMQSHVEYEEVEIFIINHPVGRVPLHVSLTSPYFLQSTSKMQTVGQGSALLIVL